MGLKEKIQSKKPTPELNQTILQVINDFKSIAEEDFKNVLITLKHIPYQGMFLILLGSKYFTNDEMTIVDFKQKDNKIHFNVFSEIYEKSEDILVNASSEEFENFFAEVYGDEEIYKKFQLYNDLANKEPFNLRIFDQELYLYLPTDACADISLADIKNLKNGELSLDCSKFDKPVDKFLNKKGEVNGFVFEVSEIKENIVTLKRI